MRPLRALPWQRRPPRPPHGLSSLARLHPRPAFSLAPPLPFAPPISLWTRPPDTPPGRSDRGAGSGSLRGRRRRSRSSAPPPWPPCCSAWSASCTAPAPSATCWLSWKRVPASNGSTWPQAPWLSWGCTSCSATALPCSATSSASSTPPTSPSKPSRATTRRMTPCGSRTGWSTASSASLSSSLTFFSTGSPSTTLGSACSWCGAWPQCPGTAPSSSTRASSAPSSSSTTRPWTT